MKKIAMILGILILFSGLSLATISKQDMNTSSRELNWVIIHYLNGDNVLSAFQAQTLEELRPFRQDLPGTRRGLREVRQ